MSDFDREAERERLREKYERDQEKRESTQRMSELLLQGATMTNRHCEECGDPVFRYEGQEFCPTCQEAVDGDAAEGGETATDEGMTEADTVEGQADDEHEEETDAGVPVEPGDGPTVAADGEATAAGDGTLAAAGDEGTTAENETAASAPERDEPAPDAADRAGDDPASYEPADAEHPHEPPEGAAAVAEGGAATVAEEGAAAAERGAAVGRTGTTDAGGSRADARAALERTMAQFAERADRTDDPHEARDLLAAAREAAEALAALDGRHDSR